MLHELSLNLKENAYYWCGFVGGGLYSFFVAHYHDLGAIAMAIICAGAAKYTQLLVEEKFRNRKK